MLVLFDDKKQRRFVESAIVCLINNEYHRLNMTVEVADALACN